MTDHETARDHLRLAFARLDRGVAGLAEDLLAVARVLAIPMSLDWRDGHCLLKFADGDGRPVAESIPLPRSVFRALLARIASLGNEQIPGSFTPHGGSGQLTFPLVTHPDLAASLVNTPDQQSLKLVPNPIPVV